MAAVLDAPVVAPEDLLRMKGGPTYELVDGQLVEKAMGQESDYVASNLLGLLYEFNRKRSLGFVFGSHSGYQAFAHAPKRVRYPDVSFIKAERLPNGPAQGHCRIAPDLTVEVLSPNDDARQLEERIHDFMQAGTPLMWVINPSTRSATIYRSDGTGGRRLLGQDLSGEDAMPGFSCKLDELFVGLQPTQPRELNGAKVPPE